MTAKYLAAASTMTPLGVNKQVLLALMVVASFFLYAFGVLTLRQDRVPGWIVEAEGPIPSAVSYLVYGTPLGGSDSNVMNRFLHLDGTVQEVLAVAAEGSIPRGAVQTYTLDGGGAGNNLFATAAMSIFGINILSLVLFYLCIIGLSTFAFVLRYRDKRLIAAPVYLTAATIMLLTPLCTSATGVNTMPIGGQHCFVLAAFLPALHIFFETIDEDVHQVDRARLTANLLLLFIQSVILFGALLVRSSTSYVLGPLIVALIWKLHAEGTQRDNLIGLLQKVSVTVGALVFWVAFVIVILPQYVHNGRVLGVFWHRAFISFSLHPDWPFPGLQEVYECRQAIPEGLTRHHADGNGHCIWWSYPPNAEHPEAAGEGLYGGQYDKVIRNAYFYVLTHYPKKSFELYFNVKSEYIKNVLSAAWRYLFEIYRAPVAKRLFVLVAAQVLLFVAIAISIAAKDLSVIDIRMTIFPAFFVCSLAPLYVAWATEWTTSDTVLLMYSCLILAALLLVQLVIGRIPGRSRIVSSDLQGPPIATRIRMH